MQDGQGAVGDSSESASLEEDRSPAQERVTLQAEEDDPLTDEAGREEDTKMHVGDPLVHHVEHLTTLVSGLKASFQQEVTELKETIQRQSEVIQAALQVTESAARGWADTDAFVRAQVQGAPLSTSRSEERRVGKECRSRWSPYH